MGSRKITLDCLSANPRREILKVMEIAGHGKWLWMPIYFYMSIWLPWLFALVKLHCNSKLKFIKCHLHKMFYDRSSASNDSDLLHKWGFLPAFGMWPLNICIAFRSLLPCLFFVFPSLDMSAHLLEMFLNYIWFFLKEEKDK